MNCSGKHSGMLVTSAIEWLARRCVVLSPDHPLHNTSPRRSMNWSSSRTHIGSTAADHRPRDLAAGLAADFDRSPRAAGCGTRSTGDDDPSEMVGGTARDVTHFMRAYPA
jgi:hypothetical protein